MAAVNYGDGETQGSTTNWQTNPGYTFDPMGNRSSKQGSVSGTQNYTVNNANIFLTRGANSYTNDLDGNTLTGGGRTNTWDSENRLASALYGPAGREVHQRGSSQKWTELAHVLLQCPY